MSTLLQPFHPAAEAAPTEAFLRFEGVGKVYPTASGPSRVLDAIDLDIHQGEFLCVIGHSGCGKSTLLNMVSGFATPTAGQVVLHGKPITRPGPDRMVVFEVGDFYWTVQAPDIVNSGREEQGSVRL